MEFGLAVHEKFVPQDMRPLHKKLVDQFFVMKSSLGIQVRTQSVHRGQSDHCHLLFIRGTMKYPIVTSFGFSTKLHHFTRESSNIKIGLSSVCRVQLL